MSSLVAQACALARYVLLARLLGPEQLGLAATLILTAQFFDSITNTGGDRYLVQHADGDRADVQALVHATAIARGVVTAAALVIFAGPIARFFGQPMLAGGLALMALAPLFMAFTHLDLRRQQRHNDFTIEGRATIASELIGLAVTVAAALILRNYMAALCGIVARSLVLAAVSHIGAERSFRLGMARDHLRPLARFSLPLMLNGLLLFVGAQSDRVVVGDSLGPAALGFYSAVLLLILYPSAMVQRFLTGTYLPRIAAGRDDPAARTRAVDELAAKTVMLALAMVAGFALVTPMAVLLLYGPAFRQGALMIAVVGILQATRFLRLWPATDALAAGRSGIVLSANIVRIVGLPIALLVVASRADLILLVTGFIAGELISLGVGVAMTNRAAGRRLLHGAVRIGSYVAGCIAVAAAAACVEAGWWTGLASALAAGVAVTAGLAWHDRALLARSAGMLARRIRRRRVGT